MHKPLKLIVGLGNPGSDYEQTRHNAGAWFIQALAAAQQVVLRQENKFLGLTAKITLDQHDCYLLFPQTFMNLSGQAVVAICQFYKIAPAEILVAHDELDLPAGKTKLKFDGGHAGHNGIRDIITKLHTPQFLRLRIGIDHPRHRDKVLDYVLNQPNPTQRELINQSLHKALTVLPMLVKGELNQAMQYLHGDK